MRSKSKSPELCIKPIGGLCNRMRVIDSAIALARKTNSNVHIMWQMNADLNCRFEELWDISPNISKITQVDTSDLINRAIEKIYRTKIGGIVQDFYLRYIAQSFDLVLTYDRMESYKSQNYKNCDFVEMVAGKRVFINAIHRFYDAELPFGDFVPIERLQQTIDDLVSNFDNVIGVHIRRTDNQQSVAHSSTAKFIELMQAELHADARTMFFVATDSPGEEEQLKQVFPGRIITHRKRSLDRSDRFAIQDAAIDLYCLSNCRKLIGSYWSSFTDTAHQIQGIEYLIVKSRPLESKII
jgi:hypothetical protein